MTLPHLNVDEMIDAVGPYHTNEHKIIGRSFALYNRQQAFYARPGGIVVDVNGQAGMTLTYEGLAITNGDDTVAPWLNFTHASATANLDAGHICTGTGVRASWGLESRHLITLGATVTSMRCWMGFHSADPMASSDPAIQAAMFRYDTGVDGTAFWRAYTNDGTSTGTATTLAGTNAAIAASTRYDLRVKVEALQGAAPNKVMFWINDELLAVHTSNIPLGTANLLPIWQIRTLAASQRPWKFNQCVFNSQAVY